MEVLDYKMGAYSMSIHCKVVYEENEWVFVGVYSPAKSCEVDDFSIELDDIKAR